MRELVSALEVHLKGVHKAACGDLEASSCELPCTISDKYFPDEHTRLYCQNALRQINQVIHEQIMSEKFKKDINWKLGKQLKAALNQNPNISSVAFLGKSGSHSHRSALEQYQSASMHPVDSFAAACHEVLSGRIDAAVLPIDNSTAGTISDVYDLLLRHELHIVKGASLYVRNVLLGVPGAELENIKEVWTHAQPIFQCSEFIRERNLIAVSMESTAVAAEAAARRNDKSIAAIASHKAGELYGLLVLAEGIDDMSSNQTRFVTVMSKLSIPGNATRVSLVFTLPHESGALSKVLTCLANFGLNVVKIQSRPIPARPWEYSFHLDFVSEVENPNAWNALYVLDNDLPYMKLLGWYNEEAGKSGGVL